MTDDQGTLVPEHTQTTADGQRVVEVYEQQVDNPDDPNGEQITAMNTVDRGTSLKEQVEYFANDLRDAAVSKITLAQSGAVETGGSDDAPTVTITMYETKAPPEAAPQSQAHSTKAKPAAKES